MCLYITDSWRLVSEPVHVLHSRGQTYLVLVWYSLAWPATSVFSTSPGMLVWSLTLGLHYGGPRRLYGSDLPPSPINDPDYALALIMDLALPPILSNLITFTGFSCSRPWCHAILTCFRIHPFVDNALLRDRHWRLCYRRRNRNCPPNPKM